MKLRFLLLILSIVCIVWCIPAAAHVVAAQQRKPAPLQDDTADTADTAGIYFVEPDMVVANAGDVPVVLYAGNVQEPITKATIGHVDLQDVTLEPMDEIPPPEPEDPNDPEDPRDEPPPDDNPPEIHTMVHAMVPVGRLREGIYDVTITGNGQTYTLPKAFKVVSEDSAQEPAPQPGTEPPGQPFVEPDFAFVNDELIPVTMHGLNLEGPVTEVTMGDVALLDVEAEPPSMLHAVVPVYVLEDDTYDVVITTEQHTIVLPMAFSIFTEKDPDEPDIYSVFPDTVVANAWEVPITLHGTNFTEPITQAFIGDVALRKLKWESSDTVHAIVPVADLDTGIYDITMTNNNQTLELEEAFMVLPERDVSEPDIYLVTPDFASTDEEQTTLFIHGVNLQGPITEATIGDIDLLDVQLESPEMLVATVPTNQLEEGIHDIVITSNGNTLLLSEAFKIFSKQDVFEPELHFVTPEEVADTESNVPITISGFNLEEPITDAKIGAIDLLDVEWKSPTTVQAVVPVEQLSSNDDDGIVWDDGWFYDITITSNGHPLTLYRAFAVVPEEMAYGEEPRDDNDTSAPGIETYTVQPDTVVANTGDVPIEISGIYLEEPVTSASIGDVALSNLEQESPTTLNAIVPVSRLTPGTYDITIVSNDTSIVLPSRFTVESDTATTTYRIMVYLACDNDLDQDCYDVFNNLELAASRTSRSNVQIVVLWDKRGQDNSAYYIVQPDSNPYVEATYTEDVHRFTIDEVNTAREHTLVKFMAWAQSRFPAQNTVLVFTGHGNAWEPEQVSDEGRGKRRHHGGIFWDENPGANAAADEIDAMPTRALGEALTWATTDSDAIDVVYFDICLGSSLETIAEVAEQTTFIVAHENITWAQSGHYANAFGSITSATTPEELAISIADEADSTWLTAGHPNQIGVIRADQVSSLLSKLDSLAQNLYAALQTERDSTEVQEAINEAIDQATRLDVNGDYALTIDDKQVDMYEWARLLRDSSNAALPETVQTTAGQLIAGIEQAVVAHHTLNGSPWPTEGAQFWSLSKLHGLSLYLPSTEAPDWKIPYYNVDNLPVLAGTTHYDEFVQKLHEHSTIPEPEPCTGECPPAPTHIALSIEPPAMAAVDSIIWVPFKMYGPTTMDGIRTVRGIVTSSNPAIVAPANDLTPRLGTLFPTDSLNDMSITESGDGWDIILTAPFVPIAPTESVSETGGLIVEIPFRAVSTGAVQLTFDRHTLVNSDAEFVNHQALDGTMQIVSQVVSGAAYLDYRAENAYDGITVEIQGASGTISTTTTNEDGSYHFPDMDDSPYTLRLTHPLFVAAKRSNVTVNPGETVPDIGLWPGDTDQDGDVDNVDWRTISSGLDLVNNPAFDIDDNGTTDERDITILAGSIGRDADYMATTNPSSDQQTGQRSMQRDIEAVVSTSSTTARASSDNLKVIEQDNGDMLIRLENGSNATYAVGIRATLDSGETVRDVALQGAFAGHIVHWLQDGTTLYITAVLTGNEPITAATDMVRISTETTATNTSATQSSESTLATLTIAGANIVSDAGPLETTSSQAIYLPMVMR